MADKQQTVPAHNRIEDRVEAVILVKSADTRIPVAVEIDGQTEMFDAFEFSAPRGRGIKMSRTLLIELIPE